MTELERRGKRDELLRAVVRLHSAKSNRLKREEVVRLRQRVRELRLELGGKP